MFSRFGQYTAVTGSLDPLASAQLTQGWAKSPPMHGCYGAKDLVQRSSLRRQILLLRMSLKSFELQSCHGIAQNKVQKHNEVVDHWWCGGGAMCGGVVE